MTNFSLFKLVLVIGVILALIGVSYTSMKVLQKDPSMVQSQQTGELPIQPGEVETSASVPENSLGDAETPVIPNSSTMTPQNETSIEKPIRLEVSPEEIGEAPPELTAEDALQIQQISEPRVQLSKTVSPENIESGGTVVYEITMLNIDAGDAEGVTITDSLPQGFSYQPGSATLSEEGLLGLRSTTQIDAPLIDGQRLIWSGPFVVPAESILTLSFRVTAPSNPGTYFNNVSGSSANGNVIPTGDTAPITIQQR